MSDYQDPLCTNCANNKNCLLFKIFLGEYQIEHAIPYGKVSFAQDCLNYKLDT